MNKKIFKKNTGTGSLNFICDYIFIYRGHRGYFSC